MTTTPPIKFVDEIPEKRGGASTVLTEEVRAALKANPGQWALIKTYETTTAPTSYAKARNSRAHLDGIEAASRVRVLYLRYNPDLIEQEATSGDDSPTA